MATTSTTATSTATATLARVVLLRAEAGRAGDSAQVALCTRALKGERRALRECVRVLREAEAAQD